MTTSNICPDCGLEIPTASLAGNCPKCLLKAALPVPALPGGHPLESDREGNGDGTAIRYFGDYELLSEIARGGMGIVYQARQVNLNRIVALKTILTGQFADEAAVHRFHVEAAAAAKLDHPGIVPIFEIGEYGGQHYFSMAYVPGTSLAQRVAEGPLPSRSAAELTAKIAAAVQYAHEQGIVHRDLKPANVLLDETGQPRVTDFGLAKELYGESGLTGTGQVLGTPSYMPPEQAAGRGSEIGPKSDVYALGALLYCLLTGRPPFQAATPLDTVLQVMEHEPVSPRVLVPQIPADLETIVLKCLEKEPSRRYSTAQELADELGRYLRGEPIVARPIGGTERLRKWIRRRPAVAGLSAAVALSLVVGTLATGYFALQAERRAADATRVAESERDARVHLQANHYVNQIARSYSEWRAGNSSQAVKLLEETNADQRGWEWNFLRRLCAPQARVLEHPSGVTRLVAFSSRGRFIAAATEFQDLQIWDLTTGRRVATKRLHATQIAAITFTPDERHLVSVDQEGVAIVWDRESGESLARYSGWQGVRSLEFSSDGSRLLTNTGVRDPATGELQTGWEGTGPPLGAAFVPGSSEIQVMRSTALVRLDASGETLEETPLRQPALLGRQVLFHHDASRVVAMRTRIQSNTAENWWGVFDARTLEPVTWLSKSGWVDLVGMTISPNSQRIAITTKASSNTHSDRLLTVWDAPSGQELVRLRGPHPLLDSPVFDPTGDRLAWANGNVVLVWQFPQLREARRIATTGGPLIGLGVSDQDGGIVWGDRTGEIQEIDRETGEFRRSFRQTVLDRPFSERTRLALSPSGERIALSNNLSIDVVSRRETDSPVRVQYPSASGHFTQALFNQDESQIVAADAYSLKRWNARTGVHESNDVEVENVSAIARSANGSWLAVARIDPKTSRTTGEQRTGDAPSEQNPIEIFDAEAFQRRFTLSGLPCPATCLEFSPDGALLAAGTGRNPSSFDPATRAAGMIRVWSIETGSEISRLPGHPSDVLRLAFAPDGRRLFSAGSDGTVRLWDVQTQQEILNLRGHRNEAQELALSESGWLTTGGGPAMVGEGEILLWDGRAFNSAVSWPILEWPGAPVGETPFARPPADPVSLRGFEGAVAGICASSNDRYVAAWPSGDQQPLVIWDARTGEIVRRLSTSQSAVSGAAIHPDRSRIAVVFSQGNNPGILQVMEIESGETLITMPGATDRPVYSADGSVIAAGYADGQGGVALRVWSAEVGDPIATVPGVCRQTCLNSDGRRVAGALASRVVVADARSGEPLLTWHEPGDMVRNLAIAPAGDLIAASGSGIANIPGVLRIKRVPGGELLHELRGQSEMFTNAVFSSDGLRLATTSHDGTIRIWDVERGLARRTIRSVDHRPEALAFFSNGQRLVVGSGDGTVRIWSIEE